MWCAQANRWNFMFHRVRLSYGTRRPSDVPTSSLQMVTASLTLMTSSSVALHSTDSEMSVTAPFSSTETTLTGKETVCPVSMAVFRISVSCRKSRHTWVKELFGRNRGATSPGLCQPSLFTHHSTYLWNLGGRAIVWGNFPRTWNN